MYKFLISEPHRVTIFLLSTQGLKPQNILLGKTVFFLRSSEIRSGISVFNYFKSLSISCRQYWNIGYQFRVVCLSGAAPAIWNIFMILTFQAASLAIYHLRNIQKIGDRWCVTSIICDRRWETQKASDQDEIIAIPRHYWKDSYLILTFTWIRISAYWLLVSLELS